MTDIKTDIAAAGRSDIADICQFDRRRWLPINDLAALLQCTSRTIYRGVKAGSIEKRRQGHRVLYRQAAGKSARTDTDMGLTTDVSDTDVSPMSVPVSVLEPIEALIARLEAQAVELEQLRRERELWETRARRWRRALKKYL